KNPSKTSELAKYARDNFCREFHKLCTIIISAQSDIHTKRYDQNTRTSQYLKCKLGLNFVLGRLTTLNGLKEKIHKHQSLHPLPLKEILSLKFKEKNTY